MNQPTTYEALDVPVSTTQQSRQHLQQSPFELSDEQLTTVFINELREEHGREPTAAEIDTMRNGFFALYQTPHRENIADFTDMHAQMRSVENYRGSPFTRVANWARRSMQNIFG